MRSEDTLLNRDDTYWTEAPLPRRLHRCTPWTTGMVGGRVLDRCACGGMRILSISSKWTERNSRRKKPKR